MSEPESVSERELAEFFRESVFSDEPKSVGEAMSAEPPEVTTPVEGERDEPVVVVEDEPTQMDTLPPVTEDELGGELAPEPEEEDAEGDTGDDINVVWATKKYGDDPAKWAKAAYEQEQHISRLAAEKKSAEELSVQWYEHAMEVEQAMAAATQQSQMAMPLSSAEENWIEQALVNPLQYARDAAAQGKVGLFNGILARIAEEGNPQLAVQIGAQVTAEMQALASQEHQNGQPVDPPLQDSLATSIHYLGIDLQVYGEPMSAKIEELGESHPYVQTILYGDQQSRNIALMAVYDLVRATAMSTRRVRSDEREAQIKQEADLRRQAAGVVTGGPTHQEAPRQSPFFDEMEAEWKRRGQWGGE